MSLFGRAATDFSDWLSGSPNITELVKGSSVNLAVTGLSRAGKTVFITSLVHNLLSALHQPHRMPLLKMVGEGRLVASLLGAGNRNHLLRFPYEANLARMAASPADWPPRTADISEIEIEIRFVPSGAMGFFLGKVSSGLATLTLRIIDYPGEWLLALPLLTQNYSDWSRATINRCRRGVRAETAVDFLGFLSNHRFDASANEDDAKRAHELYRQHLVTARERHNLSFLQPGRFLDPGPLSVDTAFWFSPLDIPERAGQFAPHTLAALMERRFERYKAAIVMPFYRDHFRNFSRQVVLVVKAGAIIPH